MKKSKTLLSIAQLGNPVLRKKSRVITDISDPRLQDLIDNMIATMTDVNGVGIAASQVYQSVRVFIIASKANPRYPDAPTMKPLAMINPILLKTSPTEQFGWEGCLSIPGIRGYISRWEWLRIAFTTRQGKRVEKNIKGFVARIFQHEFDHINGSVYLDRLTDNKNIISEKEFLKRGEKLKKAVLGKHLENS